MPNRLPQILELLKYLAENSEHEMVSFIYQKDNIVAPFRLEFVTPVKKDKITLTRYFGPSQLSAEVDDIFLLKGVCKDAKEKLDELKRKTEYNETVMFVLKKYPDAYMKKEDNDWRLYLEDPKGKLEVKTILAPIELEAWKMAKEYIEGKR
jgi:hypothetical protein